MQEPSPRFSLLLVDDEPLILSSLKRIFFEEPYLIHEARDGETALALLKREKVDAALVDLQMPGMDGLSLLKSLRRSYPHIMVLIFTGHGGVREAVEAIQLGAMDFLEKPFSREGLQTRVGQLHEIWRLREENRTLRKASAFTFGFERFIGNSTPILRLKQMISRVAQGDASILIMGETGSGKELVARAIHHLSPRREGAFVAVDCAAIRESILESELFGHVKGAFTGAHAAASGLIRSADKGTLFLDEVGELSPVMQARFLRTIQEREVRPVGSTRTYPVDIRVVAATNRDLEADTSSGRFREDLLYRLNVVALKVPPLRERPEDIPLLVRHFLKRFENQVSPVKTISQQALLCMERYFWPGNVRELENVVRRAMALGGGERIEIHDLPESLQASNVGCSPQTACTPSEDTLAAYEKAAIQNALRKSDHNRKMAAQILDTSESTLYRKIRLYDLMG